MSAKCISRPACRGRAPQLTGVLPVLDRAGLVVDAAAPGVARHTSECVTARAAAVALTAIGVTRESPATTAGHVGCMPSTHATARCGRELTFVAVDRLAAARVIDHVTAVDIAGLARKRVATGGVVRGRTRHDGRRGGHGAGPTSIATDGRAALRATAVARDV